MRTKSLLLFDAEEWLIKVTCSGESDARALPCPKHGLGLILHWNVRHKSCSPRRDEQTGGTFIARFGHFTAEVEKAQKSRCHHRHFFRYYWLIWKRRYVATTYQKFGVSIFQKWILIDLKVFDSSTLSGRLLRDTLRPSDDSKTGLLRTSWETFHFFNCRKMWRIEVYRPENIKLAEIRPSRDPPK